MNHERDDAGLAIALECQRIKALQDDRFRRGVGPGITGRDQAGHGLRPGRSRIFQCVVGQRRTVVCIRVRGPALSTRLPRARNPNVCARYQISHNICRRIYIVRHPPLFYRLTVTGSLICNARNVAAVLPDSLVASGKLLSYHGCRGEPWQQAESHTVLQFTSCKDTG